MTHLTSLALDLCDSRGIPLRSWGSAEESQSPLSGEEMLWQFVCSNLCIWKKNTRKNSGLILRSEGSALSRSWDAYAIYFRESSSHVNTVLCHLPQAEASLSVVVPGDAQGFFPPFVALWLFHWKQSGYGGHSLHLSSFPFYLSTRAVRNGKNILISTSIMLLILE